MRKLLLLLAIVATTAISAQHNSRFFNAGYDLVSYQDADGPIKGSNKFTTEVDMDGDMVKLKFKTQMNLDAFTANPEMYMPAYGGYCAWALANSDHLVIVDAKSFVIQDDMLHLFFKAPFYETKLKWQKKPEKNKVKADKSWSDVSYKN